MSLMKYKGKKVIIETTDKQIFRGTIGDYVYPDDNENGKESIIIDAIGKKFPIELYESDIKTIDIVK